MLVPSFCPAGIPRTTDSGAGRVAAPRFAGDGRRESSARLTPADSFFPWRHLYPEVGALQGAVRQAVTAGEVRGAIPGRKSLTRSGTWPASGPGMVGQTPPRWPAAPRTEPMAVRLGVPAAALI